MKSLTVFDPAAADNTGAGDSTPVPELIRFASDAEWLKRKGVAVERWNLVSDPMEFALNHRVSMFLKRHGAEDLPYILVNGAPVLYGRYPTRAELAGWFGVSLKPTPEDCAAAASPRKPQSVWVYHAAALRPSVIHETPGTESGTGLRFLDRAPKTLFFTGKGGSGKTTMAAAVAVRLAALGHKVHLSTCDPAAHIEETLSSTLPNLTVSKIDPAKETEEYRSYVMETQGARLDAAGRALLEEDLRSPCTEEIAVLSAISRVFSEAADQFVVMDNPPNGHSRVFLDLSESYRKEQEKKAGRTDAEAFRSPILFLQDPTLTKMIHVTVAETTPVAEARSLEESLRNVGIEPWAYIVNCSLSASSPVTPILRQRAAAEIPLIKEISERSPRLAIVPLVREEPVGFEKLRQLTEPSP